MPNSMLRTTAREADAARPDDMTTTSTAPEPGQLCRGESKASKRAKLLTPQQYSSTTNDYNQLPAAANLPHLNASVLPISIQPPLQPIVSATPSGYPFANYNVPQPAISVQSIASHCNVSTPSPAYLQCSAAFAAAATASVPISCTSAILQHGQYDLSPTNSPLGLQHGEFSSLYTHTSAAPPALSSITSSLHYLQQPSIIAPVATPFPPPQSTHPLPPHIEAMHAQLPEARTALRHARRQAHTSPPATPAVTPHLSHFVVATTVVMFTTDHAHTSRAYKNPERSTAPVLRRNPANHIGRSPVYRVHTQFSMVGVSPPFSSLGATVH